MSGEPRALPLPQEDAETVKTLEQIEAGIASQMGLPVAVVKGALEQAAREIAVEVLYGFDCDEMAKAKWVKL